jgi:hypothetical protein
VKIGDDYSPNNRIWKLSTRLVLTLLFLIHHGASAQNQQSGGIIGSWHYQGPEEEIIARFDADGTMVQVSKTSAGEREFRGHYRVSGQLLQLQLEGDSTARQITCRFPTVDEMVLTYPTGQTIRARRIKTADRKGSPQAPLPESRPSALVHPTNSSHATAPLASPGSKLPRLLLQHRWEPNEKAFSLLVPKGWQTAGGIFNVNPLQMNGPGNTLSPKCDFSVRSDDRGTMMIRWMPSWNFADLTYSPTGFGLFKPGQYYQGMPVRVMVSARQFLMELLGKERPQASNLRVIAEDPMGEVTMAFTQQAQAVNQSLRQMGIAPICFESLAMVVEYTEGGQRFRETAMTTMADNRHGAFQWSNENTILARAPADAFDSWKPILDMIQVSLRPNPEWLAAVAAASGERAKKALETQQYINRVANEIVENRRRTHAEIRHEQWLFITGREEYKNPFTGEIERGTSAYRYRWENNQGEVLYADENGFDPNRYEEYNTREWKRSEVWDRRK